MSLGSVGSNPYAQLQSAIDSARERTSIASTSVQKTETEKTRTPRSAGGGSLFQRLYGNKIDAKEEKPVALGTRFDIYA